MAIVHYRTCDRCGERISDRSRLLARVKRKRMPNIKWVLCGIVSDRTTELCGDCSESLDEFLYPRTKK